LAKGTILIIEDEKDIAEILEYNLRKEGYQTITAANGEEGLEKIRKNSPDIIILDLMLPGIDGFDVCRQLKTDKKTNTIPILMLTAKSEDTDIVTGLELGADDYVTKPFSPKVIIARIRAIIRRLKTKTTDRPEHFSIFDIEIDIPRHQVRCSGNIVELSASEFSILVLFAENPGQVFSRNQIINEVKGGDYPVTERSVDVQILGLRKRLGSSGSFIETVRGIGYRMKEEHENK
jgi:two-component system, OmpR family, alkaline phosphatase synthesis response regulator PhoP